MKTEHLKEFPNILDFDSFKEHMEFNIEFDQSHEDLDDKLAEGRFDLITEFEYQCYLAQLDPTWRYSDSPYVLEHGQKMEDTLKAIREEHPEYKRVSLPHHIRLSSILTDIAIRYQCGVAYIVYQLREHARAIIEITDDWNCKFDQSFCLTPDDSKHRNPWHHNMGVGVITYSYPLAGGRITKHILAMRKLFKQLPNPTIAFALHELVAEDSFHNKRVCVLSSRNIAFEL